MPTEILLDPARLDLSRVVATKEAIYSILAHRGRFALLDGILHRAPDGSLVVGFKEIRADDWWAPDHVPGRPLFPGVLMIEAGAQLASWDFLERAGPLADGKFLGFGGVGETRFRGTVEPGARLLLAASLVRQRSRMFTYDVQGFVADKLVFETQVLGIAL